MDVISNQNLDDTFAFKAAFGSSVSFSASNNQLSFGDNYSQIQPKGINSLKMTMDLNFDELIDTESHYIISFLQRQFYYEVQEYNPIGHFDNKRIEPFWFQPFYPYKKNLFNCLSYSHSKSYYDVNSVSANFEAIASSNLQSVEPSSVHLPGLMSDYSLDASSYVGGDSQVLTIENNSNSQILLKENNFLYESGNYNTYKVKSSSVNTPPSSSNFINLTNSINSPIFSFSGSTQHSKFKNSIFIDNPNDCSFYPYEPIVSGTNTNKLNVRMFDFRPTMKSEISHQPKFKKSSISEEYYKYNKYGFNPNLSTLNLTFDARSNLEAKSILLFLESHLGYKKFGFHFQKDYNVNSSDDINTTPHRSNISYFYCPSWSHTFVYFNNHTITATFIECPNI